MWLQGGCVQFDTRQRICVLCGYRVHVYSLTLDRGVVWLQGGCVQFDTRQRISVLCGYRVHVYSLTLDRGVVCCVVTGCMCTV